MVDVSWFVGSRGDDPLVVVVSPSLDPRVFPRAYFHARSCFGVSRWRNRERERERGDGWKSEDFAGSGI